MESRSPDARIQPDVHIQPLIMEMMEGKMPNLEKRLKFSEPSALLSDPELVSRCSSGSIAETVSEDTKRIYGVTDHGEIESRALRQSR